MYEIENKVILITGAANGIGACMVKEFLEKGALHVAILDIDDESGKALEEKLSTEYGENRIKYYHCDVTSSEIDPVYEKILEEIKCIDVVINNAGICNDTPDVYSKEINVNVSATITNSLQAYFLMREDQGGKGGTIINITSISALMQVPELSIYGATKIAIRHFTNCLGLPSHYNRSNVRCITVCFGITDTEMGRTLVQNQIDEDTALDFAKKLPKFSWQSAEAAARGLIEAYEQGESASTWLVTSGKPARDITANITEGYKIMSQGIFD